MDRDRDHTDEEPEMTAPPHRDQVRILIVDDAIFMRRMLRDIFEGDDWEIVGEAKDGVEAVDGDLGLVTASEGESTGATGKALSFCDIEERGHLESIERLIRMPLRQVTDHPYLSPLPWSPKTRTKVRNSMKLKRMRRGRGPVRPRRR